MGIGCEINSGADPWWRSEPTINWMVNSGKDWIWVWLIKLTKDEVLSVRNTNFSKDQCKIPWTKSTTMRNNWNRLSGCVRKSSWSQLAHHTTARQVAGFHNRAHRVAVGSHSESIRAHRLQSQLM